MWYDEEVTPGLSAVSLLDRSNLVVLQGGAVNEQNRKLLELPVAQLRPGIYTVSWKVLSAVDGHVTRGAFAFTYLPPGVDPAVLLESGKMTITRGAWGRSLMAWGRALTGWAHLAALFIVVGSLHFALVVLASGRAPSSEQIAFRQRLLPRTAGLATRTVILALVTAVLWWEINTHLTADTTLAHFMFRPALLPHLLGVRTNQAMVLRLVLLLLVLVFLQEARKGSPPSLLLLGYCEAVGAVTLLGIALSSHSAAVWASPLAVVVDAVHLWAGALWIGGLAVLALTLVSGETKRSSKEGPSSWILAMRRFTPWAAGSVAVLVLTGFIQVWLHIPRPQSLLQTNYGLILTLKLLLVLPMLFLGAVNSLMARSGDTEDSPKARGLPGSLLNAAAQIHASGARRLRSPQWAVRAEASLGLVILLCVAILTQLPPPKAASSAPPPATLRAKTADFGVELTILSSQGLLAPSDLSLTVRQLDGRPVEGVTRVTFKPSMPGMEMNIAPIVMTPAGSDEFRAKTLVSMLGRWEFAVVIRRKGVEEDAVFRFPYVALDVAVGQMEVGPTLPERLSFRAAWSDPATQGKLLGGASLIILGVAIAASFGTGALAWRRRRALFCLAALPLLLIGGYQMVNAMALDSTPTAWHENPVPADASSLAKGRALYVASCATCHGEAGRGGNAPGRGPIPSVLWRADLTGSHMEAHSDGDLFWWISKGIRGRPMPAFEDSLRPEDRWHVVNYVRSLRRGAAAGP